jgi:hypothetical protein
MPAPMSNAMQHTERFEANGRAWLTDPETLALMREYRDQGNAYMVGAVFTLGIDGGRIKPAQTPKGDPLK